YSCALQKDILMHGRLYASPRYLCFYASIFGWETSLSLRWKDVTAITKEKTALVLKFRVLNKTKLLQINFSGFNMGKFRDNTFNIDFFKQIMLYIQQNKSWSAAARGPPNARGP
ncbi:hypothetical protein ACJJTC_008133, partial [Scirpophaga incertulas]